MWRANCHGERERYHEPADEGQTSTTSREDFKQRVRGGGNDACWRLVCRMWTGNVADSPHDHKTGALSRSLRPQDDIALMPFACQCKVIANKSCGLDERGIGDVLATIRVGGGRSFDRQADTDC